MKNLFYLILCVFLLNCSQPEPKDCGIVVTFDDDKSMAIRAHFQNYLNNDVAALKTLWSPDLKIYMNSVEAAGVDEISALITMQHENFDNITMSFADDEGGDDLGLWVQTITYPANNGYPETTMSQVWFTWKATGKISGKELQVPAHIGFQWGDGMIVKEWHNFDPSSMQAELALASN